MSAETRAGRELDRLIAERVFETSVLGLAPACPWRDALGWHVRGGATDYTSEQPVYLGKCFCDSMMDDERKILGHYPECLKVVPFYSAPPTPEWPVDIGSAWLVVEKMQERFGFHGHNGFTLMRKDEDMRPARWYCEFSQPSWQGVEAGTPALAICRAALDAVVGSTLLAAPPALSPEATPARESS
jgi:hypothetical protein